MSFPTEPNLKPGVVGQTFLWDLSELHDRGFVGVTGSTETTAARIVRYVVENWCLQYSIIINAINLSNDLDSTGNSEIVNNAMAYPCYQLIQNNGKGYVRLYIEGTLEDFQDHKKLTRIKSASASFVRA